MMIQEVASATAEFAFAPAERDVYSNELTHNVFAPLGAKPVSEITCEQQERVALLRS
jgi:hypothetical protein